MIGVIESFYPFVVVILALVSAIKQVTMLFVLVGPVLKSQFRRRLDHIAYDTKNVNVRIVRDHKGCDITKLFYPCNVH